MEKKAGFPPSLLPALASTLARFNKMPYHTPSPQATCASVISKWLWFTASFQSDEGGVEVGVGGGPDP